MKKIPTLFKRDPETKMRTLTREVNMTCLWVVGNEGRATRKFDGTCAMVRGGALYKRREVRPGKPTPENFELAEEDKATGKKFGWLPVGDNPEDKYFREAFVEHMKDGTYELIGPKIQGNPEGVEHHMLVLHGEYDIQDVPVDYDGIEAFLSSFPYEGIVWHHPDGRMAKIKRKDFGFK